jgi:hypothetical protein
MTVAEIEPMAVAAAVGEPLASRTLDGEAKVRAVSVPGVEGTVVWSVRDDLGDHPIQVYVGRWPDGSVRVLTADQTAWADLIAAVGAHISSPDQAREYVATFLEVTRGAMVIVRPVASIEDLRWRPGSTQEEAVKAAVLAAPPVMAPSAGATPTGFHIELTLVVDQDLQRNTFDVTAAGEISSSFRVLAKDLPFPIAR